MNTTATTANVRAQERLACRLNGQPETLVEIVDHEAWAIGPGERKRVTSSPARWRDWLSSSDGPGRARPKTMRTAWRSGTPRSGTGIGTWDSMRV